MEDRTDSTIACIRGPSGVLRVYSQMAAVKSACVEPAGSPVASSSELVSFALAGLLNKVVNSGSSVGRLRRLLQKNNRG